MKRIILSILLASVVAAVTIEASKANAASHAKLTASTSTLTPTPDVTSVVIKPNIVIGDGGGGGVVPCRADTYGAVAYFYNFFFGTTRHVCRYAGGFVYWASSISSWVYAGAQGAAPQGTQWACNLSPSCYVIAYVPS